MSLDLISRFPTLSPEDALRAQEALWALLRRQAALLGMELLKQGSRLSVLPCEEDAFTYIEHMAEELAKGSAAF